MALNILETGLLSRIEALLDALEARGKTSAEFSALCLELQKCLEEVSRKQSAPESVSDSNDDLRNRLISITSRIRSLETFSTTQAEITSNLQKYIGGPDK